ncbi:aminoimidazole riboside kinase [Bacillus sp. AK128]
MELLKGVICLGEALIDFIPLDASNITYEKCPGGAPANVAVGVSRLGGKASFLGKVGKDVLGDFLVDTLNSYGVNVEAFLQTDESKTGLVFVTNKENGERSFDFYIKRSADQLLYKEDIQPDLFKENNILHFGSISMIHEPSRSATLEAIRLAKQEGLLLSYDPNLRLGLWESPQVAKEVITSLLPEADLLKISEEELEFLTGKTDLADGLKEIEKYQIPLIFVTLGAEGSLVYYKGQTEQVSAMKVNAIDTTGAGDAFVSAILYQLSEHGSDLNTLTIEKIVEFAKFASVSGGLAASVKGAMTALPTQEQVTNLLK